MRGQQAHYGGRGTAPNGIFFSSKISIPTALLRFAIFSFSIRIFFFTLLNIISLAGLRIFGDSFGLFCLSFENKPYLSLYLYSE